MAYSAAVSLQWVLDELFYFSDGLDKISYPEPRLSIIRLQDIAFSIQTFDVDKDYQEAKSLEKEIRNTLWRAEDIIESYMSVHFLSSEDEVESCGVAMNPESKFSQDLLEVIKEIESAKEKFDQFAENVLRHGVREDSDSKFGASVVSLSNELIPQDKNKMVSLQGEVEMIKDFIFSRRRQQLGAFIIHGMGGIGKTSLAITIYNDWDIRNHFSIVAWVKLSLEHCVRDILLNLLHVVEVPNQGWLGKRLMMRLKVGFSNRVMQFLDDKTLELVVQKVFARARYLVLVDCLSEVNESSWEYIKNLLPDSNNGSRIILVNRKRIERDDFIFFTYKKALLDQNDSWDLLRERVFGEEPCPLELEKIGERIAENCKGLPLAIITVGTHLAKEEKTVEYWNKVAESGNSLAYKADGASMFEQLGLSYKQLPQRLRFVFLYMGVFPENHFSSMLELCNLWAAEGLMKGGVTIPDWDSLREGNLVSWNEDENYGFGLHHAMWHFCCYKAQEEELFHVMDKYYNDRRDFYQGTSTLNIRRLVIRKTVIFAINGICQLEDSVLAGIRSLLFTGSYHPYPLTRIPWDCYKMLRVLNAPSIRFYEFPDEILCLNLLRYLSLTLNGGQLPYGISKMRSLCVLIVHFHHIVRSSVGDPNFLPMDIWEMQLLHHLEVVGFDLPIPPPQSSAQLPNLAILCGVTPHSCRKEVLERIPNLTGLRIVIDLAPKIYADGPPLCPFDHLSLAEQLDWLDCKITNPFFERNARPLLRAVPGLFSLTKLNLTGCGFPWEMMEQISRMPCLVALHLKCHAFRGPKWVLTSSGFERLRILTLEELDIVDWTTRSGDDHIFPRLAVLRISHCHNLQQVPLGFVGCPDLGCIQVVDCSMAVETWARSVRTELSHTRVMALILSGPRGSLTTMT